MSFANPFNLEKDKKKIVIENFSSAKAFTPFDTVFLQLVSSAKAFTPFDTVFLQLAWSKIRHVISRKSNKIQ